MKKYIDYLTGPLRWVALQLQILRTMALDFLLERYLSEVLHDHPTRDHLESLQSRVRSIDARLEEMDKLHYQELASYIDYKSLSRHVALDELAEEFDPRDLLEDIDLTLLAEALDPDDIAAALLEGVADRKITLTFS